MQINQLEPRYFTSNLARKRRLLSIQFLLQTLIYFQALGISRSYETIKLHFIVNESLKVHLKNESHRKPVLVLIHGLCDSSYTWINFFDSSSKHVITWPAIALDMRGFGHSPLGSSGNEAQDRAEFGPDVIVQDIRRTLIEIKVLNGTNKIILWGHSMGGRIASIYAAEYPEDVKALVVEDQDIQARPRREWVDLKFPGVLGFKREYNDMEESIQAFLQVGYPRAIVDEYLRDNKIRYESKKGKRIVFADPNPVMRSLSYDTILSTACGAIAWGLIASVPFIEPNNFPIFLLLASETITNAKHVSYMKAMMKYHPRRLNIIQFSSAKHNIHNSQPKEFLIVMNQIIYQVTNKMGNEYDNIIENERQVEL